MRCVWHGGARTVTDFTRDFYEKKIFEPYLHFGSKEDEDAYRKREAETKQAIADALAMGTPEGNLRAAELSLTQLKDAGTHGAERSADYEPMLATLTVRKERLADVISQPVTQSTERLATVTDPALDAAKDKIDPAMLAAFGAMVVRTDVAIPAGSGVAANIKPDSVSVRVG